MFFKFKPFEEYAELSGVIGFDGCPYWIQMDVVHFLQYTNPHKVLKDFYIRGPEKNSKKIFTVREIAPPRNFLNYKLAKQTVFTFDEMVDLMTMKSFHFKRVREFVDRFERGHLAEPIPDWKQYAQYIHSAVVVTLNHSRPNDQYTGAFGTMKHWLEMYAKTVKDHYKNNALQPLNTVKTMPVLKAMIKSRSSAKCQQPPILTNSDPSCVTDLEDRNHPCGVSSSMSPSARMLLSEEGTPSKGLSTEPPSTYSNSSLQPPTKKRCQSPKTPYSPFASHDAPYSVESPAPVRQFSVPHVKYVPVTVNEEYLVEAPDSVPPPRLLLEEGAHRVPGLFQNNVLQPAKELDAGSETTEEWVLSSNEEKETSARLGRDKSSSPPPLTVSVKQNRRKQTHPMRMMLNQPLILPKVEIQVNGKKFALGVTLCLDKLYDDAVKSTLY